MPRLTEGELRAFVRNFADRDPITLRHYVESSYRRLTAAAAASRDAEGTDETVERLLGHAQQRRQTGLVCAALAAGDHPGPSEPIDVVATWDGVFDALAISQERLVHFIEGLWPLSNIQLAHEDPAAGPMNCKQWVLWQYLQDNDVAAELETAVVSQADAERAA
jgi:hypothetical protein